MSTQKITPRSVPRGAVPSGSAPSSLTAYTVQREEKTKLDYPLQPTIARPYTGGTRVQ